MNDTKAREPTELKHSLFSARTFSITTKLLQEAQPVPRDRAMRHVSWNLVNCHATVLFGNFTRHYIVIPKDLRMQFIDDNDDDDNNNNNNKRRGLFV